MRKTSSAPLTKANPEWRVGIVASSFYKREIDGLVKGAIDTLVKAGIPKKNVKVYPVAGSFEVPLIGEALAFHETVDALIGFGIIVQGETKHADLLAQESARAIMDVQLTYQIPFAFEILWVENLAQATARSIGKGNKGEEAARAVLDSLAVLAKIK